LRHRFVRSDHAKQITNAITDNGVLTGLEASLLNLQGTELVVLSACDSGSGEIRNGEGVMSLRRAFRIAGAETVLASHWKVSDKATSLLITEFVRRWRAGEQRAHAWREAQLTLLRSKDQSGHFELASDLEQPGASAQAIFSRAKCTAYVAIRAPKTLPAMTSLTK